jgi:hypothetical protein
MVSSPIWGSWPGIQYVYYYLTTTVLLLWGALSDERTGLCFVYAAGTCQRYLSRVRVPWDSRPYFTLSDLRLPFSSPPTTRRVTVEVLDPASTRGYNLVATYCPAYNLPARTAEKTPFLCCCAIIAFVSVGFPTWSLLCRCLAKCLHPKVYLSIQKPLWFPWLGAVKYNELPLSLKMAPC